MAIVAITICAIAVLLMRHTRPPRFRANDADSVVGYLPAQVVNQATEIVAMTDTF